MDKKQIITQIENNVKNCQKCRLCKTAKNPVPGEGNINSEVIFIGEAPGQVEDDTGRPFVGRAGKLLEFLLKDIGLKREDVWIGNIIKHRPPENRDPLPDELIACEPYLTLQIKTIAPLLVVTLGRFSMNYFYPDGKISRDRAHVINAKGFNVYPVYHPAAALRNPSMAQVLKQDFLNIPNVLKQLKNPPVAASTDAGETIVDGQLMLGL
jgi:uracil-DNA glycosylase family 4